MLRGLIEGLEQDWKDALADFMRSRDGIAALDSLDTLLNVEPVNYHPTGRDILNAFHATPFNDVRVVIIGQDPYPDKKNATGVAFSTPILRPMGKSAAMIYCAIATDLGGKIPIHGNLDHLTQQGVLLLNRCLTYHGNGIEKSEAMTKWSVFTEAVVKALSDASTRQQLHFMLWGKKVEDLKDKIDTEKHRIHEAPHPSPLNINSEGFRICRHFSAVNNILRVSGEEPINWLP